MKRTVLGTLGGAAFGGVIAAVIPALFVGATVLFVESAPMDRQRDLARLPYVVAFCCVCGSIVGGLAGLASRFAESGVPFLRCCMLIALVIGVVRLLTAPHPKVSEADQYYFSYAVSLFAGVVVTVILMIVGVSHTRARPPTPL